MNEKNVTMVKFSLLHKECVWQIGFDKSFGTGNWRGSEIAHFKTKSDLHKRWKK